MKEIKTQINEKTLHVPELKDLIYLFEGGQGRGKGRGKGTSRFPAEHRAQHEALCGA